MVLKLAIMHARLGVVHEKWLQDQIVGKRQVVKSLVMKTSGCRYGGDGHPGCTCRNKVMSTAWMMSELKGAGRGRRRPTARQYQRRHPQTVDAAVMKDNQKVMMTRRRSSKQALQMATASGSLQVSQPPRYSTYAQRIEEVLMMNRCPKWKAAKATQRRAVHAKLEGEARRLGGAAGRSPQPIDVEEARRMSLWVQFEGSTKSLGPRLIVPRVGRQ